MDIGFIGLGNMGLPMAKNLAKAGLNVLGFDIAPTIVKDFVKVEKIAQAVEGMDIVITMLPDGKTLTQVYNEIIPFGKEQAIFVDCSTVDVDDALHASDLAKGKMILPIDAPVSGGVVGAEEGTLTFMVGGSWQAFDKVKPLFEILGQKAVLCGDNGAGQAAKICNNMILGISMIGVCEAFALADELNLDRQKMFEVVSTASGQCWSLNTYCPATGVGPNSPSDHGYLPGFASELMLKDLTLAQSAASAKEVFSPMGKRAKELYSDFIVKDGKGKDFSAMLNFIKSKNKT